MVAREDIKGATAELAARIPTAIQNKINTQHQKKKCTPGMHVVSREHLQNLRRCALPNAQIPGISLRTECESSCGVGALELRARR